MLNHLWIGTIGLIECFGLALNTKFLQRSKVIPCFASSFLNQILWFVVIGIAIETIHNWPLRITYAVGFAIGDILAILLDNKLEKIARLKGLKPKKRIHKRKKR